jgi:GH24 family phage-related lysozyme (muramidase)
MKISKTGIELIKHFESLHDGDLTMIGLQPKMDPVGIWTVGYGHALKDTKGNWLRGGENKTSAYLEFCNLTEEQACDLLDQDLNEREEMINSLNLDLKQYEFDSLVSFIYNVGFNNLKKSSLLRRIQAYKRGDKIYGSAERIKTSFLMWNKAKSNGELKVLNGLTRRRNAEAKLFLSGILNFE